jgi:hypothetical protein
LNSAEFDEALQAGAAPLAKPQSAFGEASKRLWRSLKAPLAKPQSAFGEQ